MICYFDTSAFVPLVIDEPSSSACRRLWEDADDVMSSQLLYVEAAAALAQAARCNRITAKQEAQALRVVDRLWSELYAAEPTERLIRRAAVLTSSEALRGYDALHCATAEQFNERDLIFASGDRQQLKAGENLGFYVADVNDPEFAQ
ncbi:type II toxin-antitoxin system VapC family toxin [Kribbella sp. NPDC026596]|uniref:type II toxin-antitoxin system VapC family toxin n=1 Tax=Kribbella sp. NPDC026596 TaxID=3155122 RepID=UPI00340830FD